MKKDTIEKLKKILEHHSEMARHNTTLNEDAFALQICQLFEPKPPKIGEKVLIQAVVVKRCCDNRPEDHKGYVVRTSRGEVMVEPYELLYENIANGSYRDWRGNIVQGSKPKLPYRGAIWSAKEGYCYWCQRMTYWTSPTDDYSVYICSQKCQGEIKKIGKLSRNGREK